MSAELPTEIRAGLHDGDLEALWRRCVRRADGVALRAILDRRAALEAPVEPVEPATVPDEVEP